MLGAVLFIDNTSVNGRLDLLSVEDVSKGLAQAALDSADSDQLNAPRFVYRNGLKIDVRLYDGDT